MGGCVWPDDPMGDTQFGRDMVFVGFVLGQNLADSFVTSEKMGHPCFVGGGFWGIYAAQGVPLFDLVLLVGADGLAFCDDWVVGEESSSAFVVENSCSGLLDCRYLFLKDGDVYIYMEMLSLGCPRSLWRHILFILIEPSDKEVHEKRTA